MSRGELAKRLNVERRKNATPKWMTMSTALHDLWMCDRMVRSEAHPTSAKPLTGASRPICRVRSRQPNEIARPSGRIRVPEDVLRLVVVAAQTCIHAFFAESDDTAIPPRKCFFAELAESIPRRPFEDSLIGIDRRISNLQHDQYNRIHLREFKDQYPGESLLKSPVFTADEFRGGNYLETCIIGLLS